MGEPGPCTNGIAQYDFDKDPIYEDILIKPIKKAYALVVVNWWGHYIYQVERESM